MRSIKKPSKRTGRGYSKAEAIDILTQTRLLQESIDALNRKAMRALMRPNLTLVKSETLTNPLGSQVAEKNGKTR